ncbi:MAG: aldo/keto reductase, partial [Lachnospiraceae bacterium]|nr:aldo/keto reductase [Lachnospiraceae bacterium]
MKRLADVLAVLLLVIVLSACGRQAEEAHGGQTESLKPTEQAEVSQPEAEESAVEESAEKAVQSNFADGEDTEIQEGGSSAVKENPFHFETRTVMLNSGYEMPIYGLGTYSLTGKTCVDSVTAALNSGVRLIDTAYMYHNEESVGEAVRNSGIPREEIFVITKLYPNQFSNPEAAIEEALERLDIEYIDMMLLHHPGTGDVDAYLAMEKAVEEGKIRSIGLSNWYVEELETFLPQVTITPALVQNEIHPYYQENDVIPYIQSLGIVVQGWYPLGGRGYTAELLGNEVISQ